MLQGPSAGAHAPGICRSLKTALLPSMLLQKHPAQDLRGSDLSGRCAAEAEPALPLQVDRLDSLRASGPLTIARMIKNCGPQIFACVNDPECKAALDCLQACSATDQVMRASLLALFLRSWQHAHTESPAGLGLASRCSIARHCRPFFAAGSLCSVNLLLEKDASIQCAVSHSSSQSAVYVH